MAHRAPAPKPGCRKLVLTGFVAVGGLVALCGAALADCDDIAPAQKPVERPVAPRSVPPAVKSWQPAHRGDPCSPSGAVWHSSTGATLTCGRHGGLGYDTWR